MPGLAGDGFRAVAGGTGQQGVQVIGFEGNVAHPAGIRRLSFYPAQLHAAVQLCRVEAQAASSGPWKRVTVMPKTS